MNTSILQYNVDNSYLRRSGCSCGYEPNEVNEELKFRGVTASSMESGTDLLLKDDGAPK